MRPSSRTHIPSATDGHANGGLSPHSSGALLNPQVLRSSKSCSSLEPELECSPLEAVLEVDVARLDGPDGNTLLYASHCTARDAERSDSLEEAWGEG